MDGCPGEYNVGLSNLEPPFSCGKGDTQAINFNKFGIKKGYISEVHMKTKMLTFKTANIYLASLIISEIRTAVIERVEIQLRIVTFYIKYDIQEHERVSFTSTSFKTGAFNGNISNFTKIVNDLTFFVERLRSGKASTIKEFEKLLKKNKNKLKTY
jgi:intein-encoded DNA endonuclease-like protein